MLSVEISMWVLPLAVDCSLGIIINIIVYHRFNINLIRQMIADYPKPNTQRNLLPNNNPHLLNAYAAYKKLKQKNGTSHRPKGKENRKGKHEIRSEQFPTNAVKFKQHTNDPRQPQILRSKQSNTSDQMLGESFGRHKQIQIQQNCKQNNPRIAKQQPKPTRNESDLCATFNEAVTKIFKGLDIFNRGRISETNINKWIPESALYFLGSVFQQIRQQRLTASQQEFIAMCQPLLKQSTEEDIKWFIEDVNGKAVTLNVSINQTEESHLCQASPVQRKKQSGTEARKQDSPFKHVIQLIKLKEKDMNTRLQSIKIKQQQLPPATQINHQTVNSGSKRAQECSARKQPIGPTIPTFNYSIKREIPQKVTKLSQKEISNFTFEDNKVAATPAKPQNKYENSTDKRRQQQRIAEYQSNLLRPATTRIVRQNITPHKAQTCLSQRSSLEHSRIDKLNNKLEQYIQFNQEKIERNRQFLRENSTPKH